MPQEEHLKLSIPLSPQQLQQRRHHLPRPFTAHNQLQLSSNKRDKMMRTISINDCKVDERNREAKCNFSLLKFLQASYIYSR